MHSSKYNDLIKSLRGSSWLVLLTLADVTKRPLSGFQIIKISKFLSNTNTKVNVTCITAGFMTSVPNSLFLRHNSFWPEVTANGMLAVHLLRTKHLSCSYRHTFTDRTVYEYVCLFAFNIPTSDSFKQTKQSKRNISFSRS